MGVSKATAILFKCLAVSYEVKQNMTYDHQFNSFVFTQEKGKHISTQRLVHEYL